MAPTARPFGHKFFKLMAKQRLKDGLSINKDARLEFYKSVMLGKHHQEPFPNEGRSKVLKVLGLISLCRAFLCWCLQLLLSSHI